MAKLHYGLVLICKTHNGERKRIPKLQNHALWIRTLAGRYEKYISRHKLSNMVQIFPRCKLDLLVLMYKKAQSESLDCTSNIATRQTSGPVGPLYVAIVAT